MMSKKVTLPLLSLLLLVALSGAGLYFYQTFLVKQDKVSLALGVPPWELALDEVEKVWRGEFSLSDSRIKNVCPHVYLSKDEIPKELKACRPELFRCFFVGRTLQIRQGQKFMKAEIQFSEKFQPEHFPFDLVLKDLSLEVPEKRFRLKLNNECRKASLPQGFYWGSEEKPLEKRVFHTNGIDYRIDRYLVRNLDILFWLKTKVGEHPTHLKFILDLKGKDLFMPAIKLYPKDMEDFCRFDGGQILSSHIKTALTFHHGRSSTDELTKTFPSSATAPHPFGPRKNDSLRDQLVRQKLTNGSYKFDEKSCDQIISKECKRRLAPSVFGMGWSGISELLGGPMEYVQNHKYPRKNLHPSSYHYSIDSPVHEAANRIFWNGKSFESLDFNFGLLPPPEESGILDVGFRCMGMRYL